MPTDPKWRVVAKRSGRPLSEVLAVFVWMMTTSKEGELVAWNDEDVAAGLDMDCEHVVAIREAMQGKTLEGDHLTGWERFIGLSDELRPPASEWRLIRERIFARDDYTCRYCDARGGALECDHVIPVSRGGSNDDGNLVAACRACNRAKRDKLPSEWRIH